MTDNNTTLKTSAKRTGRSGVPPRTDGHDAALLQNLPRRTVLPVAARAPSRRLLLRPAGDPEEQ